MATYPTYMRCFAGLLLFCLTLQAGAQSVKVPLPVANRTPVMDEFNQPLSGVDGDLVHVLAFGNGIQPPNPFSGEPHPDNRVLFTSRIGAGMVRAATQEGRFSTAIIPRPTEPFFVRVYNAASTQEASFYEDSDLYAPHLLYDTAFEPQLTATTNPINAAVSIDGISVSLKKSLGLNPYMFDTDGDGIGDRDELVMGTDPNNRSDAIPPVSIDRLPDGRFSARMHASPPSEDMLNMLSASTPDGDQMVQVYGHLNYRVEFSSTILGGWNGIARGGIHASWPPVIDPAEGVETSGFYRIWITP